MNAINFLRNEHEIVRNKFADLIDDSHRAETKKKLFVALAQYLTRHESMEQEVWYPELKRHDELKDIITHLLSEEQKASEKIVAILKTKDPEEWENKVMQLKDDVEHHAKEEETKLFPKVSKLFEEKALAEIGAAMRAFDMEVVE